MQGSTVMRQRGAETLVTEEPYALIAHVRVCGGAGWVTTGSTRKPTPNSLRSYVAPAIGRGSPPAFGCLQQILRRCACHVVQHQKQVLQGRRSYGVPQEDPRAWDFTRW